MRPGLGGDSFPKPGGLVSVEIDPATGCLAGPESTQRRQEIFISGTEPFSNCLQEPTPDPNFVPVNDELVPVSSSMSDNAGDSDYDKVSVEVCSLTGLIASPDCPKTEKRIFALGKEPIEACRAELHDAERLKGRNPKDEGDRSDRETVDSQKQSKKLRVPAPPRFKPPYQ